MERESSVTETIPEVTRETKEGIPENTVETEAPAVTENIVAPENTAETGDTTATEAAVVTEPEEAAAPDAGTEPAEPGKKRPGFLRASRSWTDILPIAAILSVGLLFLGEFLSALMFRVTPVMEWFQSITQNESAAMFLRMYFDPVGNWAAFIVLITIFRPNWPMWKAFFYNGHGNNLRAIPAGILLGGGMNGFCILMSVLSGDIKLTFNEFRPVVFFAFLFCVFVQSGAEEIVDRCYLYQKLRRRYRWPAIAILANSLVFAALHMANPDVTWLGLLQVFEIGVLFSLIVYYFDSLWTAIWAHTAWNFSQSIVFGLPNSGIVSAYSVFKLDAASARNGIFYNTGFGVEGSIGANVLITAAIVIVLVTGLVRKRGERADHWQKMDAAGRERTAGKTAALVIGWILMAAFLAGLFYCIWLVQQ